MEIFQLVTAKFITKCKEQADNPFFTKCDKAYYKLRQVFQLQIGGRALQSVMDILKITTGRMKCDDYHKWRHYTTVYPADENPAEKLQRWIKWIAHSFSASSLAQFSQPKKNLIKSANIIKMRENKRLHGYVVKKIDSTDEMSCSQACLRHSLCISSNIKESSGNCELNKHDFSTTDDDTKLTDNPDTTFSMFLKVRKVLNFHCLDTRACVCRRA